MLRIANKIAKEENTTGELTSPNTKTGVSCNSQSRGTGKPGQIDQLSRTGCPEREPHKRMRTELQRQSSGAKIVS